MLCVSAQQAIGDWESHLPYQSFKRITQSQDKIIYATQWSILLIDKDDFSYEEMSKVEGLSDIGVSEIAYDDFNEQLFVAYDNTNIDIIVGDEVINLPNIKSNLSITGNKAINKIHVANGQFAYLATSFGLVELNTNTYDFGFTLFTGIAVLDVNSVGDILYVATEDGIYSFDLASGLNPGDFGLWELLSNEVGLPVVYSCEHLEIYNGELYAVIDDTLWKLANEVFRVVYELDIPNFRIETISSSNRNLMLGLKDNAFSSRVLFFDEEGEFTESLRLCSDRIQDVMEDDRGRIWYADEFNEVRYSNSKDEECQRLRFDSPFSHKASKMDVEEGILFVASGGVTENFGTLADREGIYILEDNSWNNINESSYAPFKENELINFFQILNHPSSDKYYVASYWAGLAEITKSTGELILYNKENSSLQGTIGDEARERIAGLAFDVEENLWVTNIGAPEPLSVLTNEGTWHSFEVNLNDKGLTDLNIDENGYKWVAIFGNQSGVLVYSDEGTISDPTDDRQIFLNSSNSELESSNVNALITDLDGSVWVGTSKGVVIFDCGDEIFDGECIGRKIAVQQDSIGANLLADVEIRTMEVDGANRKWFGTRNGIFVQSPDGVDQILRFTIDNSPLFDDNIIDLEFDGDAGIMYIATDKGIQSYRTESTAGERRHREANIYAYPNPVRPEYNGPIAITGLVRDANIKITDINGRLVFETEALGGQAIWDGNDLDGNKAATGVYLVFSTNDRSFDNPDGFVTKILFVN